MTDLRAQDATLTLLAGRAPGATVCPSEVARILATATRGDGPNADWRDMIQIVHAAIDQLVIDGRVQLSWKGQVLASRVGPYRIGHRP
jgi:hypothetical protein